MAENENTSFAEKIKETVAEIKESAPEIKEQLNEKFQEAKEEVKEAYGRASEEVKTKVEEIKAEVDDFTAEQDADDVNKNKLMAAIAYIGILVLIPVFLAKDSKFAKFHANQGLVLFIIGLITTVLGKIKFLKWIAAIVSCALFICCIVGIIYAIQGKAKELPVIGNIKILK